MLNKKDHRKDTAQEKSPYVSQEVCANSMQSAFRTVDRIKLMVVMVVVVVVLVLVFVLIVMIVVVVL